VPEPQLLHESHELLLECPWPRLNSPNRLNNPPLAQLLQLEWPLVQELHELLWPWPWPWLHVQELQPVLQDEVVLQPQSELWPCPWPRLNRPLKRPPQLWPLLPQQS